MKYIRTEEGIFEVDEDIMLPTVPPQYSIKGMNGKGIPSTAVIAKADHIEDLCDGFLVEHPINAFKFYYDHEKLWDALYTVFRLFKYNDLWIYGLIHKKEGLIKVIKLSFKEKRWELL